LRNPYENRLRRLKDYSDAERQVLQEIAFAELAAHSDNRLLRRIALLHTDASVLPGAVAYVVEAWATSGQAVAVSQDGVPVGLARLSPHLPIARAALANISPRPADDAWVRAWYHATTAYLFKSAQIVALPDHLADRRNALPDDSGAAFAEGCLFEVYSSDEIQQAAQAERARGGKTNVPGRRDALLRARQLFGQVGRDAPDHAEARLRLARTHLRLDEPRAAADEIEAWLAAGSPDRQLRYYAYLVLGASQWTLANAKASAAAYGEALKLYPSAQSAVVALLLVSPGVALDVTSPEAAVLRAPAGDRTDPWVAYGIGPGRHFDALISMLWQSPSGK
jgi:tetratricopeptide (TPR) repeat protein